MQTVIEVASCRVQLANRNRHLHTATFGYYWQIGYNWRIRNIGILLANRIQVESPRKLAEPSGTLELQHGGEDIAGGDET